MTEEQMIVPKGAITLQDGGIDLDLLLPDANWYYFAHSISEQVLMSAS